MSGSEKSDKNSVESTQEVADVLEKEMSVLKTIQETKEEDVQIRKVAFANEHSTERNTVVTFAPSHTIVLFEENREPTCWPIQDNQQENGLDNERDVQQIVEQDERINGIKETVDTDPLLELMHEPSSELVSPQKNFCQCRGQKHIGAAVFERREKSLGGVTEINK